MFADMADMPSHQTRVYRFACRGDLPSAALDEMRRAHELSNRLIEIERQHEERVKEVWRQAPTLLALEERAAGEQEAADEAVQQIRRYRQKNRTTQPSAELKANLKVARKVLRETRKEIREEKERIYPILKPDLVKLGEERQAAIKATYRPAVDGGLYWANYNFVTDRHAAAVKAVRSRRKMGLPSDLRFRSWNGGEGTVVVQLQRQTGTPARTPDVLADPQGKYRNVASLSPALDPTHWASLTRAEQRKERHGVLRFRVGSGDAADMVEMPVFLHRPIPPDADACFMEIKRTRLGRRYFTHVSVVVRLPVTPMRTEGPRVAMHVGWRSLGDGSLRVAVVTGVPAGEVPRDLLNVVRLHDGWAEIVVPAWYREQMEYVRSLSSIRSKNLDTMKTWLLAWLAQHPDHGIVGTENIDRWRSPDRFAHLIQRIYEDTELDEELRTYLEAWRKQDEHVREIEDNLRDKVQGRRNNAYANVAAWLLCDAGLLVVDSYNIATIAKKPDITEDDSAAHRTARANRAFAAPGRLREIMIDGARRRGVQVQPVDGTISKLHYVCGHELDQDEREASVMVWCPTCETMVDQDANALEMLKHREPDPDPA